MWMVPRPGKHLIHNYWMTLEWEHIFCSMLHNSLGGSGSMDLEYYFGGGQDRWKKWPAMGFLCVCYLSNKPITTNLGLQSRTKLLIRPCVIKYTKSENGGKRGSGLVWSQIRFFAVPKGLADIIMVYYGTASRFNGFFWLPHFGLPTVDTLLRGTYQSTSMIDLDIGDMFLNFILAEEYWELVGVDIKAVFEGELEDKEGVNTIS